MKTLCLGIDIAWWGGSPNLRASRIETIVSAIVGRTDSLRFDEVDLSGAPHPAATEFHEANFDADGKLLAEKIASTLDGYAGDFERCVVALDAPLLARARPGQPRRPKAHFPGRRSGLELRDAERELHDARKRIGEAGRFWNRDLKIQAGSPLPPRVERIVAKLQTMGFVLFRGDEAPAERQLIEVFPSEAIWSLGVRGYYGNITSQMARWYKGGPWKKVPVDEAVALARIPLLGFSALFHTQALGSAATISAWRERIAAHAAFCALDPHREMVKRHKRFDDIVDSGIAFTTAVAFAEGSFHHWGTGDDGTIVGPGAMSLAL